MPRFLELIGLIVLLAPLSAQVPEVGKGAQDVSGQEEHLSPQELNIWQQLQSRYDTNKDDCISLDEYDRGKSRYRRLDRNKDGKVTAIDFVSKESEDESTKVAIYRPRAFGKVFKIKKDEPFQVADLVVWYWLHDTNDDGTLSAREMGARGQTAEGRLLRVFDPDLSGDVSYDELLILAETLDLNDDGVVDRPEVEMKRLVEGEGPKAGQLAPDFELPMKIGDKLVRLSSFRDDRPVALIFGSYT